MWILNETIGGLQPCHCIASVRVCVRGVECGFQTTKRNPKRQNNDGIDPQMEKINISC